jgi:UDP-N-acetylmuramoyl-L-alanyl-D-glutamate--2,6-diaminopimelate ligase
VESSRDGLRVEFDGSFGDGAIRSPLLGPFNASNLLQALAVLKTWGIATDEAAAALGRVAAPAGRMEAFGGDGRALVVVDFAHTPDALAGVVAALRAHCKGTLWCVFGCGGDRDRGKRPEMARAAAAADRVIVTDDNPRHEDPDRIVADIVAGFPDGTDYSVERRRENAIAVAIGGAGARDVVLIAGKGHEPYQLVEGRRLALSDRAIVAGLLEERAR